MNTYNSTTKLLSFYADNLFVGSVTATGTIRSTNKVRMGREISTPTNYSTVLIDEVRISNTIRSAAWIKAEYYAGVDSLLIYGSEENTGFTITVPTQIGRQYAIKVEAMNGE